MKKGANDTFTEDKREEEKDLKVLFIERPITSYKDI